MKAFTEGEEEYNNLSGLDAEEITFQSKTNPAYPVDNGDEPIHTNKGNGDNISLDADADEDEDLSKDEFLLKISGPNTAEFLKKVYVTPKESLSHLHP